MKAKSEMKGQTNINICRVSELIKQNINALSPNKIVKKKWCKNAEIHDTVKGHTYIFKSWLYRCFVALSKSYLTSIGIIMQSLKSKEQF